MKKIISIFMVFIIIFSFASCSSGKEEFRRYFPTVTSLEDIYATETENMFDE